MNTFDYMIIIKKACVIFTKLDLNMKKITKYVKKTGFSICLIYISQKEIDKFSELSTFNRIMQKDVIDYMKKQNLLLHKNYFFDNELKCKIHCKECHLLLQTIVSKFLKTKGNRNHLILELEKYIK